MTAGQKIYDLRERAGLTLNSFATMIGVDLSTVQMWENGSLPVDRDSAVLLSKAFCVDPGYFETDSGNSDYMQPVEYCHGCGLPIYDISRAHKRTKTETSNRRTHTTTYCICGLCADREEVASHDARMRDRAKLRKRFNEGLIWSGVISGIALIVTIVLCIIFGQLYVGLGVSLGIVIFLFPFIAQLPMGGFIYDAAIWAFTGPILHLPVTIFGFGWGDNFFGIVIKAIISFFSILLYLAVAVGSVAVVLIASPFTLGPCISRCLREMKRTD